MSTPFYADGLRFECTGCSSCCRHEPGYVFLTKKDLIRFAESTELSEAEFINTYCRTVSIGGFSRLSLREKENYDCIFWNDGGCTHYEARPLQCRTYPFWSSSLGDREDWDRLAAECPGANRGRLFSRREIDEFLALRQREPLLEDGVQ